MAAGSKAKGSTVNRSGQSLQERILQTMRDKTLTHVQVQENRGAPSQFLEYRNNPVGFIRNILEEKITPDIEELLESVRDNPVTQGKSANGVGKTHGAARCIFWFFFCHLGDGVQVYTFAAPPEDNLKRLLWGEIGNIVHKKPALFHGLDVKLASLHIQSKRSNEFVTGVTIPQAGDPNVVKGRFSGKHAPFLMFVGDESDAVRGEIHEAIETCMSGGHARELLLFNPRAMNGPLYQMEKKNAAHIVALSAFTHPNVVTGRDIFPGAVTREVTVQRIMKWTKPLLPGDKVDSETFLVPDFLVGYVATALDGKTKYPALKAGFRKVKEPCFSYMVLGKYSSQSETQLISRGDVERAQERWKAHVAKFGEVPFRRVSPSLGLDVADLGNDTNVLTVKYDGYIAPQIQWGGTNIEESSTNALMHYRSLDAKEIFVDSNGVGAGVWPKLEKEGCTAHRIMPQAGATEPAKLDGEVIGEFYRVRDQGWWTMREWIKNDPECMLPDDDELADELCSATYGPLFGKIKICDNDVMKAALGGRSPDKASSLMQLFCPVDSTNNGSVLTSSSYIN